MAEQCDSPKGARIVEINYRKQYLKGVIGRVLRERRTAVGITQRELSRRCGLHRNAVVNAEDGRGMDILSLVDIADALDCTLDDLVPVDWESM